MSLLPSVRGLCLLALALAGSGAGSGCGGSGYGGGGDASYSFYPASDAVLSSNIGLLFVAGTPNLVGDTSSNDTLRTGLRFGISPFLDGKTILSAKLRLMQQSVNGNPYGLLGTLVVDRVDFGVSLDPSDYAPIALTTGIGTLSTDATVGVKEVDVTAAVAADVAALAFYSDFLLRFTTPLAANATGDSVRLEDAENDLGTGARPVLVVTYR